MRRIFSWLMVPFAKYLHHLVALFLLLSLFETVFLLKNHLTIYAIYLASNEFLIAYALVFLCSILPKRALRISFLTASYIVCGALFLLNAFSHIIMQTRLVGDDGREIFAAIMGTNLSEATEFASVFFTTKLISAVLIGLLIMALLSLLIKKTCLQRPSIIVAGVGLLAVCCLMNIHNHHMWEEGAIGKLANLPSVANIPDLHQYATHPSIERTGRQPRYIVLIIGEALSRPFCSLYGYEKPTNQRLEQLRRDSMLWTFSHVKSAQAGTAASFKCMMSTYRPEWGDSIDWFRCTTLPEVMQLSGYTTFWLSNQSKYGIYDNLVGKYSELCDFSMFAGDRTDKYRGMNRHNYDEELIPLVGRSMAAGGQHKLLIVHLMGNHENFKHRYPPEFSRFKSTDYLKYPVSQRETRAHYDNSIVYNDSVVSTIMQLFHREEAIVLYFPDHGLDIYATKPDYAGHGKQGAKSFAVATQIPFMVYASPSYQQNFPDKMAQIKACQAKDYRTDNLIYTVMDLAGVRFSHNNDVQSHSLLSAETQKPQARKSQ